MIKISFAAEFNHSAVVLMYHRFGETKYPSTNVTIPQLKSHIAELTSGKYNLIDLATLTQAIQSGQSLPDKTVAITIDDGFKSFYHQGWPLFKEANIPVTLFISGNLHNGQRSDYLTWAQINEMVQEGLKIGGHGGNHVSLAKLSTAESSQLIIQEYNELTTQLGSPPKLFAYPFGEAQAHLFPLLQDLGYKAAFGQQSGAMTAQHNQYYLPRFPINERYGTIDRLKMSINTVGLAVTDFVPNNPKIDFDSPQNPPKIGFTLPKELKNSHNIACYHSQYGKIEDISFLGSQRVEIRFKEKFNIGRTRINCTSPATKGRWYWYGMQFITTP